MHLHISPSPSTVETEGWAMLAGRPCCSALRPDLLHPPDKLSSSGCRLLRLQTRSRGRRKAHGLIPVAAPRLRPSALLNHATLQDLPNNQVLLAVVTASLVGQVLKPFTAAIQGKGFNWKLVISSGGIVMYDAQGVRRAVGKQAEVINTLVVGTDPKPPAAVLTNLKAELRSTQGLMTPSVSSSQRRYSGAVAAAEEDDSSGNAQHNDILSRKDSYNRSENFIEAAKKLPSIEAGDVNLQEIGDLDGWRHIPLKESVGHTKFEVIVGGLWGIVSTLALSHLTEVAFFQSMHS